MSLERYEIMKWHEHLHLNLARTQNAASVVDGNFEVSTTMHHHDVIRILIVDNFVGFQARHAHRVEYAFVLP